MTIYVYLKLKFNKEFKKKIIMNEFLITIVFIIVLVFSVYSYATYLTKSGKAEDADGNFIPDAWEEKFGWFFSSKGIIMLILGIILGYVLGITFPYM